MEIDGRIAAVATVVDMKINVSGGIESTRAHSSRSREKKRFTNRIANFWGRAIIIGHNAKTRTKQASAPMLQPLNIKIRSQRLTTRYASQPRSS